MSIFDFSGLHNTSSSYIRRVHGIASQGGGIYAAVLLQSSKLKAALWKPRSVTKARSCKAQGAMHPGCQARALMHPSYSRHVENFGLHRTTDDQDPACQGRCIRGQVQASGTLLISRAVFCVGCISLVMHKSYQKLPASFIEMLHTQAVLPYFCLEPCAYSSEYAHKNCAKDKQYDSSRDCCYCPFDHKNNH